MYGSIVKPDPAWLFADPEHGPINVNLAKFEGRVSKNLAKERQNWCVKHNVMNQKKAAELGDIEITEEGTAAELAFAKHFNLWPDMSTGQFLKFDHVLASGLRTDSKQSQRKHGNLIVKAETKRNGTDLFALVLANKPLTRFQIWGYAWAGDLLRPGNFAHWLPTPGYLMRRADLLDPRDLFFPSASAIKAKRLVVLTLEAIQADKDRAAEPSPVHFADCISPVPA